jgi:hypothetical protein
MTGKTPPKNQIKQAKELQCNIDTEELTDDQHTQLIHLIAQNFDVFAINTTQTESTKFMTHKIQLDTEIPIRRKRFCQLGACSIAIYLQYVSIGKARDAPALPCEHRTRMNNNE